MAQAFDKKDPEEKYAVRFDFTKVLSAITSATVTASVVGEDPDPSLVLDGNSQIVGTEVRQRVKEGLEDCKYTLRCVATDGTETYVLLGSLPVKTFK